jgi:hypothetical protein
MPVNKHDPAHGQELDRPLERDDAPLVGDSGVHREPASIPRPLKAIREYCLWCVNGSAHEVSLCPSTSCPLWPIRFGRMPTPDLLAEAADCEMYPLEDPMTVAEFDSDGGTPLKAIKGRCLDCSGYSKAEVRNCHHVTCALYPFRRGRNPNRRMNHEQRKVAAARLKANIERGRKRGDEEKHGDEEPKADLQDPST